MLADHYRRPGVLKTKRAVDVVDDFESILRESTLRARTGRVDTSQPNLSNAPKEEPVVGIAIPITPPDGVIAKVFFGCQMKEPDDDEEEV